MEFKIDEELQGALVAFLQAQGPWGAVLVVLILMLPKIIPAVSAAVLEQRKLTHRRNDQKAKQKNSVAQRRPEALQPPPERNRRGR